MKERVIIALQGAKLAGGNPANNRVENDFYTTNPKAVEKLLLKHYFKGNTLLEPCVGQGYIAKTVYAFYNNNPKITALDIVDRGYPNTIVQDFLTWKTDKRFEMIISNPPYSLAKELFEKYPPKYIYVFRNGMATWNNGEPLDSNGKKWATTMCHAWFV